MARLDITIRLDSAAFQDGEAEEVARILRSLAERLESDAWVDPKVALGARLRDSNGNHVGEWKRVEVG